MEACSSNNNLNRLLAFVSLSFSTIHRLFYLAQLSILNLAVNELPSSSFPIPSNSPLATPFWGPLLLCFFHSLPFAFILFDIRQNRSPVLLLRLFGEVFEVRHRCRRRWRSS